MHIVNRSSSSITFNSASHKSTMLNGFKYCYATLTIQLNINYLFRHS